VILAHRSSDELARFERAGSVRGMDSLRRWIRAVDYVREWLPTSSVYLVPDNNAAAV